MTEANVIINGVNFWVYANGWDRKYIKDIITFAVKELKNKVKPSYLPTAVIEHLLANSDEGLLEGTAPFPDYIYNVKITPQGKVRIKKRNVIYE